MSLDIEATSVPVMQKLEEKAKKSPDPKPDKKMRSRWSWLKFGLPVLVILLGSGGFGQQILTSINSESANKSQADLLTQSVDRKTIPMGVTRI